MAVFDSFGSSEMDRAVAESRVWASAIDRSALGRYALDPDTFAMAHAYLSSIVKDSGNAASRSILLSAIMLVDTAGRLNVFETSEHVGVEVLFWWSERESSNGMQMEYVKQACKYGITGKRTRSAIRKMGKMVRHPERLDYYEAGIWDGPAIDKARAEDVDPNMLRSLLGMS